MGWEGNGADAGGVEDGGRVVDALDEDGAALRAGCDNDARGVRAIRSGKWWVDRWVAIHNIPCAEAHRGCGGYGVDGHC